MINKQDTFTSHGAYWRVDIPTAAYRTLHCIVYLYPDAMRKALDNVMDDHSFFSEIAACPTEEHLAYLCALNTPIPAVWKIKNHPLTNVMQISHLEIGAKRQEGIAEFYEVWTVDPCPNVKRCGDSEAAASRETRFRRESNTVRKEG